MKNIKNYLAAAGEGDQSFGSKLCQAVMNFWDIFKYLMVLALCFAIIMFTVETIFGK